MSRSLTPPVLSVAVLCYNYGRFLSTCLESILSSDLADLEVIVVNDASTDDTRDVVASYLDDSRVRLIDHPSNAGFVASLIEGSAASRGEFMTVVSADDWVSDRAAFASQVAALSAHPAAAFAFSAFGVWSDTATCHGIVHPFERDGVLSPDEALRCVLLGKSLHHSGTVIRRSAYLAAGGYDSHKRYAIDTDMWARLARSSGAVYIDLPLHAYRQHGDNMTGKEVTVHRSIAEKLDTIERVTAGRFGQRALRRAAVRRAVSEWSNQQAFEEGRFRLAWRYWWAGARLRPVSAVAQASTVRLAAGSLLGHSRYVRMRQWMLDRRRNRT